MTYAFSQLVPPLLGEVVFRGSTPLWLMIALIVLAAAGVFFVYTRESMKLHPARRIVMALLRSAAIAGIILLLCKPVIVLNGSAEKPRPIAILVDNTQSMNHRDPRIAEEDRIRVGIARNVFVADYGLKLRADDYAKLPTDEPTRAEIAMAAFQNPQLNLRDRIRVKGPLQEYLFGPQLRGAGKDWDKNITASESQTAIANSINELLQRDNNELPAAIVLVSDGRENASTIPLDDVGRDCARLKIPIFVYGIGGGNTGVLQLKDVAVQDTLFVEDTVRVPFRWRSHGITEGEIELNVSLAGKIVATKRVKVKEGEDVTEVLNFVPGKSDAASGKQKLEASIRLIGGREDDNKFTKFVRVVESKVKVLYVENSPRWEFKFLMRAFQRDRRIDASFFLVNGDEKTLKGGPPFLPEFPRERKDLFAFDLLILGDVDAAFFKPDQLKWIRDFVDEGGGFIMIAGRQHAPAGYFGKTDSFHGKPVADILPVEFDAKTFPTDDNKRPLEYLPKLSEFGLREASMSLADAPEESLEVWSKLPGWYWNYPVARLKPGAVTLLEHPKLEIEDASSRNKDKKRPMPIIARQYYGRGIAMFVASDETWRWRFNEEDKYFGRFWGQVVYQMGLPHLLGGQSQMMLDGDAILGKPARIYARLFTPDFRPLKREQVPALLRRSESDDREEQVYFEPVENQPGMYVTTITKNQQGNFQLSLDKSISDGSSLDFRVILPPDHELSPGNFNEDALRKLADQTGGKFYREESLKDLPDDVKSKSVKLDPPPRLEVLVWTRWWALMTIVGLLTAEWLVRKFSNLS